MFLPGSSVSPAVTPSISVPWNEKPAARKIPNNARKPPLNGASSLTKFVKPTGSFPPKIPKIIRKLTMMKTITVATLIIANQYSASPKAFTDAKLNDKTTIINKIVHKIEELSGNQYFIINETAAISAAIVIAQLYQ